jgi:hypothetical protein
MAPFLVNHPLLLDAWMSVRETAIARIRAIPSLDEEQIGRIYELVMRAAQYLAEWNVPDEIAAQRIDTMRREWPEFAATLTPEAMTARHPIDRIITQSAQWSIDTQELIAALMLEPFGDLIDGLTDCMATPFVPELDPTMSCADLKALIDAEWDWACVVDYDAPAECAQFWYVSEEKLEPRLGYRHEEPGAEFESPLDIGRQVKAIASDLTATETPVGQFLANYPQHRAAARRIQSLARHPYAEIRDNLIGETCLPIDILRCKLAFFGAGKFDPKSDRWTRITLAQGAPLFDELDNADDWWLPVATV